LTPQLSPARLTHLKQLEAESIHIFREVATEFQNPVLLYSIGKDSTAMLRVAEKAFHPGPLPFPLLHIDTTWNFRDMDAHREEVARRPGIRLITHTNNEAKLAGVNPFDWPTQKYTTIMNTHALLAAIKIHGFDALFGGARRDEEKSRAKERIYSLRDRDGQWDPKNQRPELWNLYNGRLNRGESIRVFPMSNWTELDIWQYLWLEDVKVVPLYFAKERPMVERNGTLIMVDDERMRLSPGEEPTMRKVRFRTLGCYPLSGAIESDATTVPQIIREMLMSRDSERQGRLIDHDEEGSMETKKREGYY
jgi:sulfate adenylyltransferase subunit 2